MTALAAVIRGVGHRFADGTEALRDVDLDLGRGAITALVGANGAGKTTLLRVAAGVLEPTAGDVEILGMARPARASGPARRTWRAKIAYLAQAPVLDVEITGRETLMLFAALFAVPRRARAARVGAVAGVCGVANRLDRRVSALSGGQRRRLHLAAGLLHEPELLLLDEPFAGLDGDGRARLWAELRARVDGGATVVVVSHDLEAVARHADIVVALEGGRVAASGAPSALGEVLHRAGAPTPREAGR